MIEHPECFGPPQRGRAGRVGALFLRTPDQQLTSPSRRILTTRESAWRWLDASTRKTTRVLVDRAGAQKPGRPRSIHSLRTRPSRTCLQRQRRHRRTTAWGGGGWSGRQIQLVTVDVLVHRSAGPALDVGPAFFAYGSQTPHGRRPCVRLPHSTSVAGGGGGTQDTITRP